MPLIVADVKSQDLREKILSKHYWATREPSTDGNTMEETDRPISDYTAIFMPVYNTLCTCIIAHATAAQPGVGAISYLLHLLIIVNKKQVRDIHTN
jgi:hypothetical protein